MVPIATRIAATSCSASTSAWARTAEIGRSPPVYGPAPAGDGSIGARERHRVAIASVRDVTESPPDACARASTGPAPTRGSAARALRPLRRRRVGDGRAGRGRARNDTDRARGRALPGTAGPRGGRMERGASELRAPGLGGSGAEVLAQIALWWWPGGAPGAHPTRSGCCSRAPTKVTRAWDGHTSSTYQCGSYCARSRASAARTCA